MLLPIEVRSIGTVSSETRDDGAPVVTGLGIPYGVWSEDLGGFVERFAAGAFTESIAADDWRSIYNHNSDYVMGRMSAGTLELREESDGVYYTAYPPTEAHWVSGMMANIKRGDVRENSFRFRTSSEHVLWEEKDGILYRTVLKAAGREVGPQVFPAYSQTSVEARSVDAILEEGQKFLDDVRRGTIDPKVLKQLDELEDLRLDIVGGV